MGCDHITPVLKEFYWLPVACPIQYEILLHTYKAIRDISPSYIKELLEIYQLYRSLSSQSSTSAVDKNSHIQRQLVRESYTILLEDALSTIRLRDATSVTSSEWRRICFVDIFTDPSFLSVIIYLLLYHNLIVIIVIDVFYVSFNLLLHCKKIVVHVFIINLS